MSNSAVVASAGQGVMVTNDQTGRTNLVPGVVLVDPATGLPYAGGAGGGGSSGGLTNTELRAAAVPVSGPVTDAQLRATPVPVSGPLTNTELRATAVPVSAAARTCTGRQTLALAAGVVTTLTVPGSSLAAAIQADGNTVRVTLDGVTAPSATVGTRIDDGVIYYVDTALASAKLFAAVACSAQVAYFDKA